MLIHALIATIWTNPKPTVLAVFDGLDEVLAHFVGRGLLVTLLRQDNLAQLLFIPVCRSLHLLFLILLWSDIRVKVLLLRLSFDTQIVSKLALLSLFTVTLLVENADDRFGVDTERYFLNLGRLIQKRFCFSSGIFSRLLLLLTLRLLGGLLSLFCASTALQVGRHLLDLPLCLRSLLILHAECPVLHKFGGRWLLATTGFLLLLWRHDGQSIVDGRFRWGKERDRYMAKNAK